MNSFNLNLPTQIFFGQGKISHLSEEILKRGTRVLLVYGGGSIKKTGLYDEIIKIFNDDHIFYQELSGIKPNPRITSVRKGVDMCRSHKLDFILAVGGGSVIDCAKAISISVDYDGDPWDFLSYVAEPSSSIPLGTILTLSATGTEMNPNLVITNEETQQKHGMSNPYAYPTFTILDPTYTYTVNKHQTACGVVDTITHCYEFYFNHHDNSYLSDTILEAVMTTAIKYGPIAYDHPKDYEARSNITWASTMALNGVANAGKDYEGTIHSLEHAISAVYDITHADGLAILAPSFFRYILDDTTVKRFARFARNVWGVKEDDDNQAASKGIDAMETYYKSLNMPTRLSDLDIDDQAFDAMIEKGMYGQDTIGIYKVLSKDDVRQVFTNAL